MMSSLDLHFSSVTDDWSTPQDLFDDCNQIFGFTLDACALPHNAKCSRYYSPVDDGLAQPWAGTVWMNPPYGRTIGKWMRKAWETSRKGATVVCLVPARVDTRWWHDYAVRGQVTFLRGRLKFGGTGGTENSAPFPSALVVFGNSSTAKRYIGQCIQCSGIFAAQRTDAQTCSGRCRVRLHREPS